MQDAESTTGRPPHEPTDKTRMTVDGMAGCGVREDEIALFLDIDPKTLRKHYRRELDTAHVRANTAVANRLYKHATGESVAAAIFWLKARAGWRETQVIAFTEDDTHAELAASRAKLEKLLNGQPTEPDENADPEE
jgi:hypothetical protein